MAQIESHSGATTRFSVWRNPWFAQTSPPRAQVQKPLRSIPKPSGLSKNTLIRFDFPFRGYDRPFGHTHRLSVASHRSFVGIPKAILELNEAFCASHRNSVGCHLLSVAIPQSFGSRNKAVSNSHQLSVASHATFVAQLRSSVRRPRASVRAQKLAGAFPPCLRNIIPPKQHTHVESRIPSPWR